MPTVTGKEEWGHDGWLRPIMVLLLGPASPEIKDLHTSQIGVLLAEEK